ncbi:MAG: tRNA (adenosine(37)-N6)-threonylcarbamoyltransferase complex ATPase subunit type 1 TsaE [bacterium]|nr:tRNA (adenosine(37)-N6)-threonylcarbamoyltransferase complex ATPase subunit type 1 TsaE [bacterium]
MRSSPQSSSGAAQTQAGLHVRTSSVNATHRVAAALEPLLGAGDVLLLSGDLGAGKTAFVQGLAVAMGVTDRVTSPTFTLAHTYQGRLRLHHLDVYRLDKPGEVLDLDLPELLDDDAVIAIEWGEVVLPELPRDFLRIRIYLGHPEDLADVRRLEFEPVGPSWRSRTAAVARALEQQREGA